jgi:hypothetical protein
MKQIQPDIFPGFEGDVKMKLDYWDTVFGIEHLFTSVYLESLDCLIRGEGQNPNFKDRNAMLTVTCMKTCKTISNTFFLGLYGMECFH